MSYAIFLDRDGTIIKSGIGKPATRLEEFDFMPRAVEGLKMMQDLGYLLVVTTNQSGVADGRWTLEQCQTINHEMCSRLNAEGILLSAIYMCTHHKTDDCDCRKPKPGMLLTAKRMFGIDFNGSYMVGNELKDVLAGKNAGCKTIKIKDDYKEDIYKVTPDYEADNLLEAAGLICTI